MDDLVRAVNLRRDELVAQGMPPDEAFAQALEDILPGVPKAKPRRGAAPTISPNAEFLSRVFSRAWDLGIRDNLDNEDAYTQAVRDIEGEQNADTI